MVLLTPPTIAQCEVDQIVDLCNKLVLGVHFEARDLIICPLQNGTLASIFHIRLTKPNPQIPPSFVIKLVALESKLPFDLSSSQLTNQLVGESGLGPKVFLVSQQALVMEYVPSRIINQYDDQDRRYRRAVARNMAKLHMLQVPIERNEHEKYLHEVLDTWLGEDLLQSVKCGNLNDCFQKLDYCNLAGEVGVEKLREERDYLKEVIAKDKHPVLVFAHNDLNRSNILVVAEDDEKRDEEEEEVELKLVDFDFSRYFYRGADFGRYFLGYRDPAIEDTAENPDASSITEDVMLEYIEHYRTECGRIMGKTEYLADEHNSAQKILGEAKLFMLFAAMINVVYGLWVAGQSEEETRDGCLIWADMSFAQYLRLKSRFQAEKSIA